MRSNKVASQDSTGSSGCEILHCPKSINIRNQAHLILKPFDQYFSDDMIIRMLCRLRIKAADKRNEREYVDRLYASDQLRQHFD
jgi:hypothetical protein